MKSGVYQCLLLYVFTSAAFSVSPLEELTNALSFGNFLGPLKDLFRKEDSDSSYAKFSLRTASDPEDDLCYIIPGKPESLSDCNFNATSKTFIVIHGWTITGMFESWVGQLVSALYEREQDANVIVVDWLNVAQDLYINAAQNTKFVGKEIAYFIDWMEETSNFSIANLHLIGYSLGAHVAGFAGSQASSKVGRITGLDPAGPDFEGSHAHRRLSPDDAHFVDVLHTFTHSTLGLSIGIEQPVGHVDIYPNGGTFQPGCDLGAAIQNIAKFGMLEWPSAVTDGVKCAHERSVHLFIDSLLNQAEAGRAYVCGSGDMFDRGVCLGCQNHRCNEVGYGVRKVRKGHSHRMYTKTRDSMPFKVFHYQLKIHFASSVNRTAMDPTLTVSLYGINGDAENLRLKIMDKISVNRTHSFLLVTEKDIGDLLRVAFRWEEPRGWYPSSLLRMMSSWWSGDSSSGADIKVRKIRVKVGETQRKMVFCVKDHDSLAQEVTFDKCKDSWRNPSKRHATKIH
ncbi:lipoprotein lipase-like [Megalops cyprinoides]|uniref:lipoprotein lipase-like n=1 Tax=Megalops cyprinoides TaxID=118141 RepID=UPI001863FF70|nr:lipoprotein lipase-like [Megalops cyprinoides]